MANVTTEVHKGWFDDTLSQFPQDGRIAVLRLDGDWFDSTLVCLEALWGRVIPNGLVLIDDYYDWSGCANAVHQFLDSRFESDNNFFCPVRSTKYGLAYLVKPA